jgi:tetratricopeptide (TPR) repeat protein
MRDEARSRFVALLQARQKAALRGDVAEEERIGRECLSLAGEEAYEAPGPDLSLRLEAVAHEENADWSQAEAAYMKALELARSEGNDMAEFKAHSDLASLFGLQDRKGQALEQAQAALEAARRADAVALSSMGWADLTRALLALGRISEAREAASASVRICADNPMYAPLIAGGLVLRARCAVELGDLSAAEADLETARPVLAPYAEATLMAGLQSRLAGWWEVKARLCTAREDLQGAAESLRKAVEFRRSVAQAPQLAGPYRFNALAATLHRYALALLAVSEVEGASAAFRESRLIRQQIGLLGFEGSID